MDPIRPKLEFESLRLLPTATTGVRVLVGEVTAVLVDELERERAACWWWCMEEDADREVEVAVDARRRYVCCIGKRAGQPQVRLVWVVVVVECLRCRSVYKSVKSLVE